jgi:hypothetical protein
MPYFVVSHQHDSKRLGVVQGENQTDAVYAYARATRDSDELDEEIEEEGSITDWCVQVMATTYHCTEIGRGDVLEYFERRLDGDTRCQILL